MAKDPPKFIARRTPESAAMMADVSRAWNITAAINRLPYGNASEVRVLFGELIGQELDSSVTLVPPFYATGGDNTRIGKDVFINQNCTMYDLGGIDIADGVMIGPNVSLITSGHPVAPSRRRAGVTASPIIIHRNVWIAANVTVIGGVTIGENSVIAAGSVVTKDVPANTLVTGSPAKVSRSIAGE